MKIKIKLIQRAKYESRVQSHVLYDNNNEFINISVFVLKRDTCIT